MFISYGPKFQKEKEIEPFSNTELYNLMCGEYFPLRKLSPLYTTRPYPLKICWT